MRAAGACVLAALLLLAGASVVASGARSPRPSVAGNIELYGDGTIVVETTTAGMREVRVGPRTVVRDVDRPATLAAVRPGRWAMVWAEPSGDGGPPVAGEIVVWGPGR